jgi:hypothetical protein
VVRDIHRSETVRKLIESWEQRQMKIRASRNSGTVIFLDSHVFLVLESLISPGNPTAKSLSHGILFRLESLIHLGNPTPKIPYQSLESNGEVPISEQRHVDRQ